MRSPVRAKDLCVLAVSIAAISFVACKSTTAEGNAGAGASGSGSMSADGGMMSADGGMGGGMASAGHDMGAAAGEAGHDMGAAAGQAGHDVAQGASSAGHEMAQGASAAGSAMADAGMQAANAAGGAAHDAASSASTAASSAASDVKEGASSAAGAAKDAAGASSGPTDPQIAAIVVAANKVDIEAAQYAKKHTKNAKVKQFANLMIKDHTSVNKQAVALVTKLGVTPEENDTSKSLTDGGKQNLDNLKTLKGKDFDKAYAEHEVAYHEQVLKAIDDTLIPNAKNEELKDLITKVRPAFQTHLDHAKMMSTALSGGSADATDGMKK